MTFDRAEVTGLIVAGGRRASAFDKGLQNHLGMPVALHALMRLAPQVGQMMINANSNLAAYESMGVPVFAEAMPDLVPDDGAGSLAGWLTGLEQCATQYLMTVPCDAPHFPTDLVELLAAGLANTDAEIAMAATCEGGATQRRSAFCLIRATLLESLAVFLHSGEREFARYIGGRRVVEVVFDDADAFNPAR